MYVLTSGKVESGVEIKADNCVPSLHVFLIISTLSPVQSLPLQTLQLSNASLNQNWLIQIGFFVVKILPKIVINVEIGWMKINQCFVSDK